MTTRSGRFYQPPYEHGFNQMVAAAVAASLEAANVDPGTLLTAVTEAASEAVPSVWSRLFDVAGAAAAGAGLMAAGIMDSVHDVVQPQAPLQVLSYRRGAGVGSHRVYAPEPMESAALLRQAVPGEGGPRCGGGKICEDFIFDMARGFPLDVFTPLEVVVITSTALAFIREAVPVMSELAWRVLDIVLSRYRRKRRRRDKRKERRMVDAVFDLVAGVGFPVTERPVRDFLGPQTLRYRRSGFMRRSRSGWPYLG